MTWAQCPFCSGVVLWGFRKDRPEARGLAGTTLVHTNDIPKVPVGGEPVIVVAHPTGGCERYTALMATGPDKFLMLLKNQGVKFHNVHD